jgi:hypothetical protein
LPNTHTADSKHKPRARPTPAQTPVSTAATPPPSPFVFGHRRTRFRPHLRMCIKQRPRATRNGLKSILSQGRRGVALHFRSTPTSRQAEVIAASEPCPYTARLASCPSHQAGAQQTRNPPQVISIQLGDSDRRAATHSSLSCAAAISVPVGRFARVCTSVLEGPNFPPCPTACVQLVKLGSSNEIHSRCSRLCTFSVALLCLLHTHAGTCILSSASI